MPHLPHHRSILAEKFMAAADELGYTKLALAGGVAANSMLRDKLLHEAKPSECPKGDRDNKSEVYFKNRLFLQTKIPRQKSGDYRLSINLYNF